MRSTWRKSWDCRSCRISASRRRLRVRRLRRLQSRWRQFSVVADAHYALAVTKFLVNDLGLFPAQQFIVDDTPKEFREPIRQYFEELNYGIKAETIFETDGYKIHNAIREHDYHGYPLILGGYWEKSIAEETKAHFLNISYPIQERLVMNSFYVGYDGGLRLLEDIYTVARSRFN